MKDALIIYNPSSGNEKGETIKNYLEKRLIKDFDNVKSLATEKAGDGAKFSEQAAKDGVHSVFAIGGDGTVNEVVLGIVRSEVEKKPILGIVPGGTFNGVSRILGFSQNPRTVIRNFDFTKTTTLDSAKYNDKIFNMIFSIGDVPEALHNVSSQEKAVFSVFAYFVNIARDAIKNTHHSLRIKVEDEVLEGDYSHVAVMLSSAVFGLPINTQVEKNDGFIHVFLLKESTLTEKIAIVPDLISGALKKNDKIKYFKTKKIEIESLKGVVETDLDGDKSDPLPGLIEVLPRAIEVYSK